MRVVNLRTQVAGNHGSEESHALAEAEAEAARARQKCRYAVAPGQQFTTPSGAVLTSGSEVLLSMLHGHADRAAWQVLESLVMRGLVLEADGVDDGPRAA